MRTEAGVASVQQGQMGDAVLGFFLMLLMAFAMVLLAWDVAANPGWGGLSAVHAAIQTLLVMAAVASGSVGAVLWIGRAPQKA